MLRTDLLSVIRSLKIVLRATGICHIETLIMVQLLLCVCVCVCVYVYRYTEWPKKCVHSLLINMFGINLNDISISG